MNVLNDIACKLNSIELNSIEKKWDPNSWRRYRKSTCEYGVMKKKLQKDTFSKNTIPWQNG